MRTDLHGHRLAGARRQTGDHQDKSLTEGGAESLRVAVINEKSLPWNYSLRRRFLSHRFRTEIATLLLGGTPKVQGLMWIEDRQVHEKVGGWVLWSGWTLVVIGFAIVAGLAVVARLRSSNIRSLR